MTLRMGDGPIRNLPTGLDAYAGYADDSGIGTTWPEIQQLPAKWHLSISIHGLPAMCGDVEKGALTNWTGYTVGYCAVSNVNAFIRNYGRPEKLWTAHYTNAPHLCSPVCWPGLVTTADGTQWTNHGGFWDESLLTDNFFDFLPATPEDDMPFVLRLAVAPYTCNYCDSLSTVYIADIPDLNELSQVDGVKVVNVATAELYNAILAARLKG